METENEKTIEEKRAARDAWVRAEWAEGSRNPCADCDWWEQAGCQGCPDEIPW